MNQQQKITLAVWVGEQRDQAPILDHQRIETPNGDMRLSGSLGLFMALADVPKEQGLHLVKATACVYLKPGFGWDCRLIFEEAKRVTQDLTTMATEWELGWVA